MTDPRPLSDAEVVELDSYGVLTGRMALPARALELWEREIYWGRETPDLRNRGLLGLLS